MSERSLRCMHPRDPDPRLGVAARFALDRATGALIAEFSIQCSSRYVNPDLPCGTPQWGLWDWDVVELFVSARGGTGGDRLPYYEFQVSPRGQHFELEILQPRKSVNREFRSGFKHSVTAPGGGPWSARMEIPLAALGWDGKLESIVGGAFAILGEGRARSYWALFLPEQETPDFHLPAKFDRLLP